MQHSDVTSERNARSTPSSRAVRVFCEPLESRQLLSAAVYSVTSVSNHSTAAASVVHASASVASSGLTSADAKFLQNIDSIDELEIQAGEYAETHASNALLATFATRAVTDQTADLTALQTAAAEEGITLTNSLSSAGHSALNHLINLSGAKFDKAYGALTVNDHTTQIRDDQRELAKTGVSAIASYINAQLPIIETDQEFAVQADDAVKYEVIHPVVPTSSTSRSNTQTSYSKNGVIQIGVAPSSTTSSSSTSIVNGVITIGNANGTSAAGQVGVGTQGLVGVGTANDGTGVQTVMVTSNV